MSNIITQELIAEISEIVQPKTIFRLRMYSDNFAYSTNLEKLVAYAWSDYCNSFLYPFYIDKISFVKELTENKWLKIPFENISPNGFMSYSIDLIPLI